MDRQKERRTDRKMDRRMSRQGQNNIPSPLVGDKKSPGMHFTNTGSCCSIKSIPMKTSTLMCLSIGTPKNNKFSICSKWKIRYF